MTPPTKQPKPDTTRRVFRGGSWYSTTASFVRAAYCNDITPLYRYGIIGFRCAQRGARQPLKGVTPP